MPFNIVGFTEATPGAGIVNVAPGGLEDLYTVNGDLLMIPKETPHVLGVFNSAISTMGRSILRQPKQIDRAIIKSCLCTDVDPIQGYTHLFGRPFTLRKDRLEVLSVNATDEDTLIGLILGTGKITKAMLDLVNPTHFIDGYSDTTITALQWSPCPITWNQVLDSGVYEIVSMRCGVYLAANLWSALARILIPGSTNWKPGVPCALMEADHEEYQSITTEPYYKWPQMGVKFDTDHMPNIEVLSPSAVTDENVELGLVKVE